MVRTTIPVVDDVAAVVAAAAVDVAAVWCVHLLPVCCDESTRQRHPGMTSSASACALQKQSNSTKVKSR